MQDMKYDDKKAMADYYDSDKVKVHPTGEFPVSFCSSSLLGFYPVPTDDIVRAFLFWLLIMPLFGVLKMVRRIIPGFPLQNYSAEASAQMRHCREDR